MYSLRTAQNWGTRQLPRLVGTGRGWCAMERSINDSFFEEPSPCPQSLTSADVLPLQRQATYLGTTAVRLCCRTMAAWARGW